MIDVTVVDENGTVKHQLGDGALLQTLNRVLAEYGDDPSFCCLRFVDPYGDTTFNHLQVETLGKELALVADRAGTPDAQAAAEAVRTLAGEVQRGVHLYLQFTGD